MSTLTHTGSHPVLRCADTIGTELDEVASVEPVFMTTREKQTALVELTRLSSRVESLKLRVLAAADDIAINTGARSTAAWLADTTRDAPTGRCCDSPGSRPRSTAATGSSVPRSMKVVLGGKSEISTKALNLVYPECTTTGCTIPAAWCEAHHKIPWSSGGRTRLADGTLLCPFHHHRAHDPAWLVFTAPTARRPSPDANRPPSAPIHVSFIEFLMLALASGRTQDAFAGMLLRT